MVALKTTKERELNCTDAMDHTDTDAARACQPFRVSWALIVDDDEGVRQALENALQLWAERIDSVDSVQAALAVMQRRPPDLILLDVCLPDGTAFDFLDALANAGPQPAIIGMSGTASVVDGFKLAQLGVRDFVSKPVKLSALERALVASLSVPPDLRPHVRNVVGQRALHDVENEVRTTMIQEALARSTGNRSGAARLLAVSRQLFQHMLRALH